MNTFYSIFTIALNNGPLMHMCKALAKVTSLLTFRDRLSLQTIFFWCTCCFLVPFKIQFFVPCCFETTTKAKMVIVKNPVGA